jgi:hypothetical protein
MNQTTNRMKRTATCFLTALLLAPLTAIHAADNARAVSENMAEYGRILSENAKLELSSGSPHDRVRDHERLFKGDNPASGFAFHTGDEKNPWAKIDLGAIGTVKAVVIENRPNESRTDGLILSVSEDGQ